MTRGDTKVRMGGTGAYAAAAAEMEQAVLAAPWNADYYFRLGMVQERAEMYGEASQNYYALCGGGAQRAECRSHAEQGLQP